MKWNSFVSLKSKQFKNIAAIIPKEETVGAQGGVAIPDSFSEMVGTSNVAFIGIAAAALMGLMIHKRK